MMNKITMLTLGFTFYNNLHFVLHGGNLSYFGLG